MTMKHGKIDTMFTFSGQDQEDMDLVHQGHDAESTVCDQAIKLMDSVSDTEMKKYPDVHKFINS